MNKVILMGRLTKDPDVKYSQSSNPIAVVKYGLAVRRSYAKPGEPDVDFFNVTAFGKAGEFAAKYFKKGQMVAVVGRLQTNSWEDQQRVKHNTIEVIAEEQHFAESKSSFEARSGANSSSPTASQQGSESQFRGSESQFNPDFIDEDDDLPF